MKADLMRMLTNRKNDERMTKRTEKHRKYASKLIETKIRKEALKGASIAELVIKRGYSPTLMREQLEIHGFNMTESKMKNGKPLLIAKW